MPLFLITGKPGNGKTLRTIQDVEALREKTGRSVYYHGIPECKLAWTEFQDAQKWYDLPSGSIIVIDEVQKQWRARPTGSEVPKAVMEVETHRHKGFDLFWMTQDAMLVDQNIRKFVHQHMYIKRIFGLEASTVYTWNQRVARVESRSDYHDAMEEKWTFPKKYYGMYKSADIHNVRANVPWKRISFVVGLAVLFVGAIAFAFFHITSRAREDAKVKDTHVAGAESVFPKAKRVADPWSADVRRARLPGIENSAAFYDDMQRPVSQPRIAGCASLKFSDGRTDCWCTTMQGSRIAMEPSQCLRMMAKGWFDPTRPEIDLKALNIAYLDARDGQGKQGPPTDVEDKKPTQ